MTKVIFAYNLEKDAENYLGSIYRVDRLSHGRKNYRQMAGRYLFPEDYTSLVKAKNQTEAKKIAKIIIRKLLVKNEEIYSLMKRSLEKAWRKREKRFFGLLEMFFEKPTYFKTVNGLFTTLPVCPYNRRENWFMVSLRHGLEEQIATICHELMHFMFLGYYWNYTYQALGENSKKAEMIKEALTVFLNNENFREVNTIYDKGYPQERTLREFLLKAHPQNKTFSELLKEGVNFLKTT